VEASDGLRGDRVFFCQEMGGCGQADISMSGFGRQLHVGRSREYPRFRSASMLGPVTALKSRGDFRFFRCGWG
jgi:hypothetical protein